VEGKANGDALVDQLGLHLANLVKVDPLGGKLLRAKASSFSYDAGKVFWLGLAPWWDELALELKQFPGRHDDQVDAGSQAILWLCAQYSSFAGFEEAMSEAAADLHGFTGDPMRVFEKLYAVR
jgi:phage terminase large subunit-like protein